MNNFVHTGSEAKGQRDKYECNISPFPVIRFGNEGLLSQVPVVHCESCQVHVVHCETCLQGPPQSSDMGHLLRAPHVISDRFDCTGLLGQTGTRLVLVGSTGLAGAIFSFSSEIG